MSIRIVALVGSARAGSHNRQLAETAIKLAPEGVEVQLQEGLAQVPFYNEDIDVEDGVPQQAAALREAVAHADAVLLFVPEYNGTMSAVLKNAIDWLSRPFGAGALAGKPVAVIGASGGQYGGVWAHEDARKAAKTAGGAVIEDITFSIPDSLNRFAGIHPLDDREVATELASAVGRLAQAAQRAAEETTVAL
ncbi:NAD(P)H-dependent FMN reductase [Streptomyces sp. 3213]|uniref:NADPH-dependent FMN reductase n=1 Tax=Streptomyces sp. 3213.3 TaxID=1855348 RepID=UPI00089D34AC|nr:NAD(P)H-dependent oxidoreductase [Streptomyces sp. 3213.3]SEF04196.1 NAD(P)H-dependent FMN reductase [Streptomyces sp. 3213] [Streptomyces sp. 3213.3]